MNVGASGKDSLQGKARLASTDWLYKFRMKEACRVLCAAIADSASKVQCPFYIADSNARREADAHGRAVYRNEILANATSWLANVLF